MTEGSLDQYDKPMCVRLWLEVGHVCEPRRSPLGRALALDWRVWVRGAAGTDISAFVHKVVFHLHPASAFVYPKRVIQEPPYEIQESGCASIDIPIHVYLKYSSESKKIRLRYSLHIENNTKSNSESRCVYYDVENPTEPLWRALMRGGGEVIARTAAPPARLTLPAAVPPDAGAARGNKSTRRAERRLRYEFVEPVHAAPKLSKKSKPLVVEDTCPKCGNTAKVDLPKHLRSVAMSEDEAERVSQLYVSLSRYERAGGGLALPPLSDPIYRVPELPPALRAALSSVEADYAMQ